MPLFEKPPLESLAPAKDRWTPLFLQHGRVEVDDSSVKWVGGDGVVCAIPIATLSCLILGPGTTITHAAVKSCADSNTPVCWTGAEGLHFYAVGVSRTHGNELARAHAEAWSDHKERLRVARAMFRMRFNDGEVEGKTLNELRGMEGIRVRHLYSELGREYCVSWRARNYDPHDFAASDDINQALSVANAGLYSLCLSVITSMGLLPGLGFVHADGAVPFVFDVADLYKHETSFPAAFQSVREAVNSPSRRIDHDAVRVNLKTFVEQSRMLRRMPKDLLSLLAIERPGGAAP